MSDHDHSIDLSLEAALLDLESYRRRFTLWRVGMLDAPSMQSLSRIQLPKASTLHYLPSDPLELGPQVSDVLIQSVPGMKFIEHVYEPPAQPLGNPIRIPGINVNSLLIDYRAANRLIRPLGRAAKTLDNSERDLIIYNYGLFPQMWKYPATYRAEYYAWYNYMQVVIDNLIKVTRESNRNQFLTVTLPDVIPPNAAIKKFRVGKDMESLKAIRGMDGYTVADLVVWIGKFRENSLLSRIPVDLLPKINLLIRRMDRWVVINLGYLETLRSDRAKDIKGNFEPIVFEPKMLKLLHSLREASEPMVVAGGNGENGTEDPIVDNQDKSVISEVDDVLDDLELSFGDEIDDSESRLASGGDDLQKLEKELAELEKLREMSVDYESVDDDGNVMEGAGKVIEAIGEVGSVKSDTIGIIEKADELVRRNGLSNREYQRLLRLNEKFESIPDPYGSGKTLKEAAIVTPEDTKIESEVTTEDPELLDKSMAKSTIEQFDGKYINGGIQKDYLSVVTSLRRAPLAVMDYRIEKNEDASNKQEVHVIKLTPGVGDGSTIRIPMPVVDDNGTFLYNGTRYRLKKQRRDMPIRKISPTEVVLSSFASKCFVSRAVRTKFNRSKSLLSALELRCTDHTSTLITDASISSVVDYSVATPWMYSTIASSIAAFKVKGYTLNFDYNRREANNKYTADEMALERKNWVLCGRGKKGPVIMDPHNRLYERVGNDWEDIGTIESLCEIDVAKQGLPMAEVKIYSANIPIGIALGYLLGLTTLLSLANVKYRTVLPGERQNLSDEEFAIRFKNEILIINTRNPLTTLIMSGWLMYQDVLKNYDIKLFDAKEVYGVALEREGITSWFLKELDTMNMMFIDPITEDLLRMMREPQDFTGLLVRATELILTEYVPKRRKDKNSQVELYERISGYDRFPGVMYSVLYKAVRSYISRSGTGRASVLVNPNDSINKIIQDGCTAPINNINPMHSLREKEVVTFGGDGGRSRRSMVAETRYFPLEDKGLISEATVDSGDVGIITYLAPNANLTSTRGTVRMYDKKRDGVGMLLSTPAQAAPCADGDDLKRVGFISTQSGHRIAINHGEVQGLRTGGERNIINRVSDEFGSVAKEDGVIKEITDKVLVFETKSKKVLRYPLGLIHTTAEGSHYPNTLVTSFTVGEKVKKGDVLTYNKDFFRVDPFNNKRVDYTAGTVGLVAFREATYTFEDSSSISANFAQRLVANTSKVKTVMVQYDQNVNDVLGVGDRVDLDTPLMVIENNVGDDESLYDDKTRETLREWTKMAPQAKVVGVITEIEVRYNGDLEVMSPSLRKLAVASDKRRKQMAEALGKPYHPGTISRFERIDGQNVEEYTAVIIIHITTGQVMTIGDKLVFGNQLKSTVGEVLYGENLTERGEQIDAIFGALSILNRITTAPFKTGPINTYLRYVGESVYHKWVS